MHVRPPAWGVRSGPPCGRPSGMRGISTLCHLQFIDPAGDVILAASQDSDARPDRYRLDIQRLPLAGFMDLVVICGRHAFQTLLLVS